MLLKGAVSMITSRSQQKLLLCSNLQCAVSASVTCARENQLSYTSINPEKV